MHLSFEKLSEKYGEIFKISLLGNELVVINDINLYRKAFQGEKYGSVFDDKPDIFVAKHVMFDCDIALAGANKRTYALRKMLQKSLKVFGDGVDRFEIKVSEELDRLVFEINSKMGKDFDISPLLKKNFANWMSSLITGKSAKHYDSEIIWDFIESVVELVSAGKLFLLTKMPVLRFLPGELGGTYRRCIKARDRAIQRFLNPDYVESDHHVKEEGGLAAVLKQMQQEQKHRIGYKVVSDLRGMILDLFVGGIDTTLTAVVNSIALLLKYPECKTKLGAEIQRVIGNSRPPNLDDRRNMPYTKAFILEVHRYISELPLPTPRLCPEDMVFEGYNLKKGSFIFQNLWYIHHDRKLWHDPWNFRPERFLEATGELLPADHELRQAWIPFCLGRRACAGQTLAMTRTFLYLTRIVQEFDIKPLSSGCIPNTDPRCYKTGGLIRVGEFLCQAIPRHVSD